MKTLRENLKDTADRILHGGLCPQCGPTTNTDEDGCCPICGADASGPYLAELATNIKDLCARVDELEGKLAICRASLDHPVNCPRCEASFLPYIDPKEVRGIAPDQLREALKP